jgi:periplasmic divalent cation tolerance protein
MTLAADHPSPIIVYLTFPHMAEAERVAQALVAEELAACVNLLPKMKSVYRWQGAIETAEEVVGLAKTSALRFAALSARVKALHSYETPCIIAWPICQGEASYLAWIADSVK